MIKTIFSSMVSVKLIYIMATIGILLPSYSESQTRLKVEIAGYVGSECTKEPDDVLLAQSQCEIVVTIIDYSDEIYYRGIKSLPPANLSLIAGQKSALSDSVSNSSSILRELNPQYYITTTQARTDSNIRQGYKTEKKDLRPTYHFLIVIPDVLVSKYLCIKAELNDTQYGYLEGSDCVKIVEPCSIEDRNHAIGSYICFAAKSQNPQRAISLTDSLIQTGWSWWPGLMQAKFAASIVNRFDRALEYLDILYSTYGRVTPTGPLDSLREQVEYQRMRTKVIERRDQQQNQQR